MDDRKHATWYHWPHMEQPCYRVRSRGAKSAFSEDGKTWIDSYGRNMAKPARRIMFHGGMLDGRSL